MNKAQCPTRSRQNSATISESPSSSRLFSDSTNEIVVSDPALPPSLSTILAVEELENREVVSCDVSGDASSPLQPVPPIRIRDALHQSDWQGMYSTLRQRSKLMFNNDLMADVFFLVGDDAMPDQCKQLSDNLGDSVSTTDEPLTNNSVVRIPAHSYILATGSSVFYAMLHGSMVQDQARHQGNQGPREIAIPDIEPKAFLNLLRYLYCDELDIEEDTVMPTLYAAKKYMVPFLAQACVSFLLKKLSASNVCSLLNHSHLFDETELSQRCWDVLDPQAKEALHSESFVDIDRKTLQDILLRETLTCREIDIYKAVQRWSIAECERSDLEPSLANQRSVLGPLLFSLRVPTMRLEEFANHVAQSGLLDLKLVTEIFLYFTAVDKPALPFPTNPRLGLSPKRCHRFQSSAQRSNQWRYRGRCDSIQFQANQRIFVAGYGLYGSASKTGCEYSVKMDLKLDSILLSRTSTSFKTDGSETVFPVMFDNPVQVEGNKWYTASVLIDGRDLSWFGQEGYSELTLSSSGGGSPSATSPSAITFQFQCSSESTNGTGVQGGQIPEIIFYG